MRLILLVFLIFIAVCKNTQADTDEGLYDPVPPEGSAFVRFVNLSNKEVLPRINNKKYDLLKKSDVSAYFVSPEGKTEFSLGEIEEKKDIVSGNFYTVIYQDNLSLLQDRANKNRSKATVAFYNFSSYSIVTLKARSGSVDVLTDVEENKTQSRDMNAVKIDFSLYADDQKILDLEDEVIERGNHYSIIYDGQEARFITATTDTTK